jgi:hypothetical protein
MNFLLRELLDGFKLDPARPSHTLGVISSETLYPETLRLKPTAWNSRPFRQLAGDADRSARLDERISLLPTTENHFRLARRLLAIDHLIPIVVVHRD